MLEARAARTWGVAEAERLGLAELLRERCARPARYWNTYFGGMQVAQRDLAETSPARTTGSNLHHPELRETLLVARAHGRAR